MNGHPHVVMENILFSNRTLAWNDRCAIIAAAGFDGVYVVPYPLADDDFVRLRKINEAPIRYGLRLAGIYANIDLALPPNHPANVRVARLLSEVEGTPRIELSFKWGHPSPPLASKDELDDAILDRLDPLLALAERRGFDIALYPHSFYPLETPTHAASLVRRFAHPRLGYLFPVSHVFALNTPEETLMQLRACAGEIASFNFCGCRRTAPGPRAKCAHFPPDEGDLPIAPLLAALSAGGYHGDLILQGHGWTGDLTSMLRRSARYLKRLP